ncbi:DUF2802 domain-containing protein [Algibacillus agarilyticus]|uniref:DUF2802 domain-containing protein n=1 Tax=Algibacillus agarilyticus TaxID=2234133 RepID=UPI0013001F3F|nr:DUF2802 domain-containing protein [Algibacillus agarilyticus]
MSAVSLILIAFCFYYVRQTNDKLRLLTKALNDVGISNEKNTLAIDEIRAGSIGMGQVIQQIKLNTENELQVLADKHAELAMHDPGSKLYNRAAKMVAKGASIEEVMLECEIPRAEAELVISMRKL